MTRRFLSAPAPIAFAHRGGADEAPENTMEAFESAIALGYRYIETDVHLTSDRVLVAFHDSELDRVTDSHGRIADLPLAAVREADAGHGFTRDGGRSHPFRGRGCVVPTLEEILTGWRDVFVNIDLKTDAAVAPLAALLLRLGALDRVCVGSFSDRRIARFRRLTGGSVCTSMGRGAVAMARMAALSRRAVPRLGADCIQVPLRWGPLHVVDAALISAAHRSGLPVHVWTIDDEPAMSALLDLGVDGIMTDRPRLLRDVLASRALWTAPSARST